MRREGATTTFTPSSTGWKGIYFWRRAKAKNCSPRRKRPSQRGLLPLRCRMRCESCKANWLGWRRRLFRKITLPRFHNHPARFRRTLPTQRGRRAAFQLLIYGEEVLDLTPHVDENL